MTTRNAEENPTGEELAGRGFNFFVTLAMAIGFILLVAWASMPSDFEKCVDLASAAERTACYEALRAEAMQPPAKGAKVPAAAFHQ